MSKNKPVEIKIEGTIIVKPEMIFESEVVKGGNGAVIKAYKKFLGRKAVVIIKEPEASQ